MELNSSYTGWYSPRTISDGILVFAWGVTFNTVVSPFIQELT